MSKKYGLESSMNLSRSDKISLELSKLKYFKVEHPRGGQYNDGYTLVAEIKHSYNDDLILLLTELGVNTNLLDVEPPPHEKYPAPIYDQIEINGESKWLQRIGYCKINGEWFYISYSKEGLRIVANGGGYEVEMYDVIRAKNIEKNMKSNFFDSRIDIDNA